MDVKMFCPMCHTEYFHDSLGNVTPACTCQAKLPRQHIETVEHYKTLYNASQGALREALQELRESNSRVVRVETENKELRRKYELTETQLVDYLEDKLKNTVSLLDSYKLSAQEWGEKTQWVQDECDADPDRAMWAEHRADIIKRTVDELRRQLDDLLRVIDASPYGEEALHHHTCPAPEDGKCTCGAYDAVDAARKAIVERKGE